MYNYKDRAFLLKNHLKSMLGATQLHSLVIRDRTWHWLEAGDPLSSETIILMHGLSMSKNHWRSTVSILAKRYRVVVPDIPGFKLDFPALNPDDGFDGIAKELGDFLGVVVSKPCHLVGHSMAATLALGLALRMAVPVRSVSMVSLADVNFTRELSLALHFEQMSDFIRHMNEEQHYRYVRSMFYQPPAGMRMMARHSWIEIQHNREQIVQLFCAMEREFSFIENFGRSLNIPVLTINGRQDMWNDLTQISRYFQGHCLTRVELEGCRHLPFIERPIEFSNALTDFLSEVNHRKLEVS